MDVMTAPVGVKKWHGLTVIEPVEEPTCTVCDATEDLTPYVAKTQKGKEVNLLLCPQHLKLAGFDVEIHLKEDWRNAKCCGTSINSNGYCKFCGNKY
jgi:hypothetical protein